jgi:hypothetical protein
MTKTTTSTENAHPITIAENKQETALRGHQETLESSVEGYKVDSKMILMLAIKNVESMPG